MKTEAKKGGRPVAALAILGLLAGGLVFTDTALAQEAELPGGISVYQQVCVDAWDDSPAEDVCSATSVTRIEDNLETRGNCDISGISCSLSATNQAGETVTWEISSGESSRSPSDTETLDMCFAAETTDDVITGHTAALKAGCGSGETTSDNMEGSTLTY